MTINVECLDTVVQNVSGAAGVFDFLPPHGFSLEANEMISIQGDLNTRISGHKRKSASLRQALKDGAIQIIRTPAVHIFDTGNDTVKTLTLVNGTLGIADPCWSDDVVHSSDGEFTPSA